MASILAYIELRAGTITRPSRFAVAEARRVADGVGATVYALLTVAELSTVTIDQLASQISAAGADRILCASDAALAGPVLDASHGRVLAQVAERLRPVLFLFPAGGVGSELGPALAIRIGAAYVANASIDLVVDRRTPTKVILARWRAARDGQRQIDLGDFERPVVATLSCGLLPEALGEPYAEVEMITNPEPLLAGPSVLAQEDDPASAPETCSALVWSTSPLDPQARAALPEPWPAGAAVVDAAADVCVEAASPSEIYLLSGDARQESPPLSLVPGAQVVQVRGGPS
jgi:hypothetical protein